MKASMGGESFDDFLRAVQSSLAVAQEALGKRREARQARETGIPEPPMLSFAIPKAGAHGDQYQMLALPLSSFRDPRRPRLASLSLEFDCEFKEKRIPRFSGNKCMVMRIRKNGVARSRFRRRVLIVFRGAERPFGEVLLDGELLMVVPPMDEWTGRRGAVAAERPLFRALSDLWRKLWKSWEFVLTEQQSGRIREILEQSGQGAACQE